MSRRQKELSGMDSTILSVASTSLEGQENRTLKVTLLSSEWKSSTRGDLSTINRELAIQLAKHSNVDVSVLLPKCSEEDRSSAETHDVKLVEADRVPGLESVLCLSSPPRNHSMDCVIGHGIHLGQQIALIKRNPNYCHCKWIQVVHSAPEEDGMYKNISEGQKKQETEIQLCKMADQVITIGPKLAEAYKRHLRPSKQEENVFDLTPSIFSEFLEKEQATEERQTFCVLVIGSGDSHEDFSVKGYDIAAKAIAELKDESYQLRFVCAPGGKGDEIAEKLLDHDIGRNQLIVRSFNDSREVLANLFCEVDLAIMPSRTEGFGITALKALSAGLPILVSGNSGLGKALKKVPVGSSSVVDSEDPKVWARAVKLVRQKEREVRLLESSILREKYLEKYSWEEPCKRLVNRMYKLTFGTSESGTIFPIRDKRPTPILVADQPSKRLREELIQSAHYELQGAEGPFVGHLPQSSMECEQFSLPRVTVSQNKPIDPRSFTQSQNRYPSSEHCQNPVAGASSTYHGGVVHQGSHPQGSSGYGSPTPEVASHIQGSLSAAILNQNNYWNPTFPQSQNIHLSSEHGQNPYAGASSTHYEGLVHQGYHSQGRNRHSSSQHGQNSYAGASSTHYRRLNIEGYPQEVNSSQGNLPTTFTNFSSQGSQTFPQSQNRHPYTGHGHPFPGACSTSNFGLGHQEYQPHGSPSYGLPAPVAVNYHQGNFAAPLVNINYQRSQTFPQMEHSQSLSASAVHRNEDPTHWGSQTQSLMRQGQWPSLVNQSLPLPQVPTWTPQDPSYHSNHTQGSFGFGLPSSSVSPAASSIQPDPVNKRGTLGSTWPSSSVSNSQLLSQAANPLPTELRCERHGDTSNCLAIVCSLLKQEYKKRSRLKPLFWDNTIQLPLEDVYTRLKILQRRKRDFQLENDEVSMAEIFKNRDDTIVLVEGSPGMGKTTFCLKIASDWANKATSDEDSFPEFEVVLLLKCRDIHGNIIEAIDEQLLPKCNALLSAIKRELIDYVEDFHYQKKVLIILDGLDELPKSSESDVNRLLQKQIFPFCYVLATSRQERGIVVRKKVDFDLLLQIEGFTREDAFDYVRKHFKNAGPEQVSRGERLIAEIKENTFLDALWNNPLNLLLLCIVFEDFQGELPSYRTELYQIIVCCILRRYCAKHELEAPVGDEALVRHFEDSLLVLGELAWRCLEEDRFSFREEELAEFESANTNLAARELGLVFKEASLRKINPQHEYYFFHKTFQEYLAAFYLAYGLLKRKRLFSNLSFDEMETAYRQVITFMCGILGEDTVLLFEQIGQKLEECKWDWHDCIEQWATLFKECFSESRNDEQVAMTLCSFVPFPQTMTIDLSNEETVIDFFLFLEAVQSFSQLQLPVHLAIRCTVHVQADLDDDTLADFLASYTRLQTLSFSCYYLTEETETLLCRALTVDSTVHSFTLRTADCFSSSTAVAIGDSLAANETLTSVIFKLPGNILKSWVAVLDKGLSADTPLTSVALEIFGPLRETAAEGLKNILLNRSLTFLSLTLFGDMEDSVTTSISEGLVANPSLKSLALMFCGKLGHTGLALLTDGFRGNESLESLELKVFGEVPTSWANISRTLHSAVKSTTSFTVYPNVTGIVGTSQVACHSPVLDKNLLASKLHYLAVNIWGELDCSGANDLCKRLIASPVSSVTLNFKGRVTDSVANCLFKHLNQLNTLCQLSISIQGELIGEGKNTLERLSRNQTYSFALNIPDANAGDKICREVGLSADESMSLIPVFTKVKDGCVTKLSVCIKNPASISGDWVCALCEGLAKSESLTTLSLIFSNITSIENIDALWDAMAENISLTTLSLTLDNYNYTEKDMTLGLSYGLAKTNSLTTLSLTLNYYNDFNVDIISDLNEGLAKNTSLTTLSLTLNIHNNLNEKTFDLNEGLAENTSLTTLSLTFNNYINLNGDLISDLNGLAKNTSLTTLSLTLNNFSGWLGEMTCDLRDGLAKNTSLTTLSLTLSHSEVYSDLMCHLGDSLVKNTSLTTLSLTLNFSDLYPSIMAYLSNSLAENTSLTTLSLTLNNYIDLNENILDLNEGLAGNTSLTTLSLTFNNYNYLNGDMISDLNGLVKNTSLTMLSLTLNNYGGWVGEVICDLNNGLAENTSLTTLSLMLNNYGVWGRKVTFNLNDGLAKNTSLTTLSLTLNNYGGWVGAVTCDLRDGLAENTSLTTLSLIVNNCSCLNRELTNGLSDGLANSKSLITHSLSLNNYSYMPLNSFFIGLWNALAKNKSLTTLNFTLSNRNNLDEDWIHELADALARNTSLSKIRLELNIFGEGI